MSKYKEEMYINIKNRSQGWTKGVSGAKYYRKDNWIIRYNDSYIWYFIIDESYEDGYYLTWNKQEFLEEKHMLKVRKTPVWRALHGGYKKEETK